MVIYFVCLAILVGVVAIDLITKSLAVTYAFDFVVIPKLVKFKLAYNTGAAFSFLSDKDWARTFFIILTFIVLAFILGFFVYKIIKKQKTSKWLLISLALAFAGAVGNLVDRLAFSKVRDFILLFYETDIFPAIFNVADISLVVGVIMICVYLLFIDKDALFRKQPKEEDSGKNGNNG